MKNLLLVVAFSFFVIAPAWALTSKASSGGKLSEASTTPAMCFLDEVCADGEAGSTNYAIASCLENLQTTLDIVVDIWEDGGYTVTELGSSIDVPDECGEEFICDGVECCQTLGVCNPM